MALPHKREKIADAVRGWLASGRYVPGDKFPSDQDLARKFSVTHVTVRSALKALVEEGLLERRIGWGTVVRDPAHAPTPVNNALANAVGVAFPDSTYSFFNELLRAIEEALHGTRRPLVLGHTWELPAREDAVVRAWSEQGLTRLIVAPTGGDEAVYQSLLQAGTRLVFVDRSSETLDVPSITSHDEQGAREMTLHLLATGARRIYHLAGLPTASTARARVQGYLQACGEAGVRHAKRTVLPAGFFLEDGYRTMKALLQKGGAPPEAVFAANDPVAVGALRALAEHGLEVPGDVRVGGYGDTDLGRNFALSSVRQFPDRMGALAVQLLLRREPVGRNHSLRLDVQLVPRASTAA